MTNYFIKIIARISVYLAKSRIEPKIKQKCDRSGNIYWQIYDPVSGYCFSLGSEQEVRAWLDTRNY